MTLLNSLGAAALAVALTAPALSATPTPARFVAKAGAGDWFELREATIMSTSIDPAVAAFAKRMKIDHSESTEMVKSAAKSDGLTPGAPVLSVTQKRDIAALQRTTGKARATLYIRQQKAAHAGALALMQDYAANGTARHLKETAGKIVPVVEQHIAMLDKM